MKIFSQAQAVLLFLLLGVNAFGDVEVQIARSCFELILASFSFVLRIVLINGLTGFEISVRKRSGGYGCIW